MLSLSSLLIALGPKLILLRVRFFADLLSQNWPSGFWHTMGTFYDGDAYPAMGLYFKFFDVAVSHSIPLWCPLHVAVVD